MPRRRGLHLNAVNKLRSKTNYTSSNGSKIVKDAKMERLSLTLNAVIKQQTELSYFHAYKRPHDEQDQLYPNAVTKLQTEFSNPRFNGPETSRTSRWNGLERLLTQWLKGSLNPDSSDRTNAIVKNCRLKLPKRNPQHSEQTAEQTRLS